MEGERIKKESSFMAKNRPPRHKNMINFEKEMFEVTNKLESVNNTDTFQINFKQI